MSTFIMCGTGGEALNIVNYLTVIFSRFFYKLNSDICV